MNKIARIQELVKELNQYRNEYYNLNKPTVSDSTYDAKFDELSALEKECEYVLSNSPTSTVGYTVLSKLQKRQHPTVLKSLDKTKSIDELNRFKNNKEIIFMLKADGLTVEIDYENGLLTGAYTRGNSEIGEDISHNALTFKNLPKQIAYKGKLRLCGEAVIHWDDFNKINEVLSEEEKYATPRNLCSGSCRQLDSKICTERNIHWYAFNILECEDGFSDSKANNFYRLKDYGFSVVPFEWLTKTDEVKNCHIAFLKDWAKDCEIPYDGMVISYNSVEYSNSLKSTAHHPLHSLAYKEKEELAESVLRSIEWNTTRSGQVNPTACFDTVILDNTEVSRASLFNLTFIEDLRLNVGSRIRVSKRNMIIPYIEENLDTEKGIVVFPKLCPTCHKETIIKNTGSAKFLYCTNDNCPAKLLDKFCHLVERDALNIEGMSEATLETFINKGWIKTFADIYRLDKYKANIIKTEGFGVRSYEKLIQAIEKSKNVKFENFIYSLGIDQIGKGGAKRLAKHFNNDIQAFLAATASYLNFISIEDFGEITACAIYEFFYNKDNMAMVKELLQYITILQDKPKEIANTNSFFSGKKVYCTGSFASYKKEELQKILEGLGAEFTSGYAKSLDYLIVGSLKGSGKEDKAKKDGVKIMTEDDFLDIIGR